MNGKRPSNGRVVAGFIAMLCFLGAIGTCSIFTAQNPYTNSVRITGERTVTAEFPPEVAKNVQPGMIAVLSFKESRQRFEGRVRDVLDNGEIRADFPDPFPELPLDRLSVDLTGIPD